MNVFSTGKAEATSICIWYICFLQPLLYLLFCDMATYLAKCQLHFSSFWHFQWSFYVQSGKQQVAENVSYESYGHIVSVILTYPKVQLQREFQVTESVIHNIVDLLKNSAMAVKINLSFQTYPCWTVFFKNMSFESPNMPHPPHPFLSTATVHPYNTLLLMGVILHVVSEESKDTMWFSPV